MRSYCCTFTSSLQKAFVHQHLMFKLKPIFPIRIVYVKAILMDYIQRCVYVLINLLLSIEIDKKKFNRSDTFHVFLFILLIFSVYIVSFFIALILISFIKLLSHQYLN